MYLSEGLGEMSWWVPSAWSGLVSAICYYCSSPPFMENAVKRFRTGAGVRVKPASLSGGEPCRVESSVAQLQGRSPWSSHFNKGIVVPSC